MTTLRRVLQLSKKQNDDGDEVSLNRHSRSRRKRRSRLITEEEQPLRKERPKRKRLKPEQVLLQSQPIEKEDVVKKMTTRSASRGVVTSVVPRAEKLEIEVQKKNKTSRKRNAVVDVSWVQCDKCKEWYVLPSQINQKSLPQNWFCEMITWSHSKGHHKEQCELRQKGGYVKPQVKKTVKEVVPAQDQWVECDECGKWRKIPSFVDTAKLPARWFCYLNVYDPLHNNCRIAQERYQDQQQLYVYTQQDKEIKKRKPGKPPGRSQVGAYDQSHLLNKLIKSKLRQRSTSSAFVYGVEEKKLKKNKRNPQSFKELIWWHHNGPNCEEFNQCQKEDLHFHFKNSSLYLYEEEEGINTSKKRKARYLSKDLIKETTFHRLFFSSKEGIGHKISQKAKVKDISLSSYDIYSNIILE